MIKNVFLLPDILLTLPVVLLLSLGILVIYSSDPILALYQGVFAVLGFIIYYLMSFLDLESYRGYIGWSYILTIGLLLVVFIIGIETRGSIRWIPLGPVNLQPSELAKPVVILLLAKYWVSHLTSWKNIFISLAIISPIALLIFKQPDLGTTLTILAIWLMMLLSANIPVKKLLVMVLLISMLTPIGWMFLKDYQKDRINSFLVPTSDPLGIGYNVIQSTIAVGSGQLLGRGLGHGTQSRLQFLPEFRTDFIFSSIAEEFGFVGSMIVLILFGILVMRMLQISHRASKFGNLIIYGVLGMLVFQIMVNIGMNIGIMPVTGITLPLLSYGGSSFISTMFSLGIVGSVVRYRRVIQTTIE